MEASSERLSCGGAQGRGDFEDAIVVFRGELIRIHTFWANRNQELGKGQRSWRLARPRNLRPAAGATRCLEYRALNPYRPTLTDIDRAMSVRNDSLGCSPSSGCHGTSLTPGCLPITIDGIRRNVIVLGITIPLNLDMQLLTCIRWLGERKAIVLSHLIAGF